MQQTFDLTDGATEYTFPVTITETTGKDISGDSIVVSFGTANQAGTWFTPDVLTRPTVSSAVVQVLVGAGTPNGALSAGSYFLWWKVTDTPEVVPRRSPLKIVVK